MSSAPIVDRIRIIPRPDDFLDRNVGSSGEVFFNGATSSLRVYSGKDLSGFEIARADLSNIDDSDLNSRLESLGYSSSESGGNASITVSDSAPADANEGQLWFDTDTGVLFVYYGEWIQPASSGISGSTSYTNTSVDTHLNKNSADAGQVLSWNGLDYVWVANASASGGEVNQNAFSNIDVAGQSSVTADSITDTFTLVAGSNVTLTTSGNAVTISSTAGSLVNFFNSLSDVSTANLTVDKIYEPAITMLRVDNNGTSSYTFPSHYSGSNPTIYAISGTTIAFDLDLIPGHPFELQDNTLTALTSNLVHVATDGTVSTNSAAQGKSSGTLYWRIPESANGTYAYQCQNHAGMVGSITVKRLSSL